MTPFATAWPTLVAAPFIGSVCGVMVRRLPAGRPVVFAQSACASCGARLSPADLVPLLSYAALRGALQVCHSPTGMFHPGIELAATAVAVWALVATDDAATFWFAAALSWTLLALAWADWGTLTLTDPLTALLVALGLGGTAWLDRSSFWEHALATALGYGIVWGPAASYRRLRGREGIGMGDAKLLAGAGAWVSLGGLSSVLLIAALSGLALAASAKLGGRRKMEGFIAVPFGTCLPAAIWIVWLYDPMQSGCCFPAALAF